MALGLVGTQGAVNVEVWSPSKILHLRFPYYALKLFKQHIKEDEFYLTELKNAGNLTDLQSGKR